jgi:HIV Tat-specific factor 1
VIAEEIDSGRPRIKLYTDEHGAFKGDALIVFFKPPSVDMAIMLLDDTPLRIDDGPEAPRMRVQAADASYKKVQHGAGEEGGQQQPTTAEGERERERQRTSAREKQKIIRKTQKLDARLADWSDDEPATMMGESSSGGGGSSRWDKVVILKHMFTLEELAEDPAAILDIKEDIREECSKLGEVTNVVLFDLEAEGVASVRFTSAEAARACVRLMDGRSFAGQKVEAYISNGQEKFKKSKKKADDHEEEEEDKV